MDNWAIFKIIGGLGIVITAAIAFFSKLIIEKLKVSWKSETDKELKEIETRLNYSNSVLSNIQANYLSHLQNTHEKRIEAIETAWHYILKTKKEIPNPVLLCLSILDDSEITNSVLDRENKNRGSLGQLVSTIDESKYVQVIAEATENIDELRPFVSEEVYSLLRTYFSIIGRVVYKFIADYKKGDLQCWKKDIAVLNLIKQLFNKNEFEYVMSKKFRSFVEMTNLLELKILYNMRMVLTGTDSDYDIIKQLKNLEGIFKLEPSEFKKD